MVSAEQPELIVADRDAWREWLGEHHDTSTGVWLLLAKKGTTEPTTLTYDLALDEALCQGWIDGQLRRGDESTYYLRFTPRRARSLWSARNVGHVSRLIREGRMQPAGLSQVERAKADGRWDAAYGGQATLDVPNDLDAALAATPGAREMFEILTSGNRFAIVTGSTAPGARTPGPAGSSSTSPCWHAARRPIHRNARSTRETH